MSEQNSPARAQSAPDFRDRMLDTITTEFDRLAQEMAQTDPHTETGGYCMMAERLCEMANTAVKLRHADLSAWVHSAASSDRTAS